MSDRARRRPPHTRSPARAAAPSARRPRATRAPPRGPNRPGARPRAPPPGQPIELQPEDFNSFEKLLGEVQTAYGKEDLNALRARVTPEMLSYYSDELAHNASNGDVNQISDIKLLQGDLSEAWSEGNDEFATVAMRYSLNDRADKNLGNRNLGERFATHQDLMDTNLAVSNTHIFNSRTLNEFRFSFIRRNLDFPENDPTSPTVGITGFFTIGGSSNFPQGRIEQLYQFQDVATFTAGRNSFKFGADIRRNQLFNRAGFDSRQAGGGRHLCRGTRRQFLRRLCEEGSSRHPFARRPAAGYRRRVYARHDAAQQRADAARRGL